MRKRRIGIMVVVIGVIFLLCYLLYIFIPYAGLKLISPATEVKLGKQMFDGFTRTQEVDLELTQHAQAFADHLQLSKNYTIRVTVVKEDIANAFAMPGGYVVIYSGLIKDMQTPEEFAALLGHEVAHINERHTLRTMLKRLTSSMMISFVISDLSSISGLILSKIDMLHNLSFGRNFEREADEEGMKLLVANHIPASGMRSLLLTLKEAAEDEPRSISFLSTHPLTEERLENADKFIQRTSIRTSTNADLNHLWKQMKQNNNDNW